MGKVLGIAAIAIATYLALQLHAGRTQQVMESLPAELAAPVERPQRATAASRGEGRQPMRLGDGVRDQVNEHMARGTARHPR